MAIKLTLNEQKERQRILKEEGNPAGTYFAITTMLVLLAMVAIYFWIDSGRQVLSSPTVQQGEHLTPHDAN